MGGAIPGKRKAGLRSLLKLGVAAFGFLAGIGLLVGSYSVRHPAAGISGVDRRDAPPHGLHFMRGKNVVLVSHELTLTGGPLLLMELAVLLKNAGATVQWMTINKRDGAGSEVTDNLEQRLQNKGILLVPAKGEETVRAAVDSDLVVLNTAVAGKWIDSTLKESDQQRVLPKVLWWIHEMRGHYFTLNYVKHMPEVAAVMIDSHATAEYWKNRTQQRLGIKIPKVHVVHLGNSKDLTEAAENPLARHLLRQHVRESLGISDRDVMFSAINSVSRGKGQDLFLKAFAQALKTLGSSTGIYAVIVGSDWIGQPKFEAELRELVEKNGMQHVVRFVNKTMNVVPYLAASDVLVQNSQARGECFGRISIEAMAFKLPILGTAAGGTTEIVVDGSTGFLHQVGKEGVPDLASNIINLFRDPKLRARMGEAGYKRVQERFLEQHMSERIGRVLKEVLQQ
ncbi:uncharacterized protein LOC112341365 [Selaginella moellendorffii]|uniref:uncharacterized protein LOC112341365 n=1 Tax=Selaginella moellendorffii TaxID=88036 RepID=UPI000D1C3D61|nr:uncharacterized protein LOC112341365 [Selaginella moellendorffii]|eukprot:XP_024517077.1 uncharacterized protein LOC112341365 [Selaginella moellendorffii]